MVPKTQLYIVQVIIQFHKLAHWFCTHGVRYYWTLLGTGSFGAVLFFTVEIFWDDTSENLLLRYCSTTKYFSIETFSHTNI